MSDDLLNEKGVAEILITLLEKKQDDSEISQSELVDQLESISMWIFNRLLPQLKAAGLVRQKRGKYRRKLILLTDKGTEVAVALKQVKETMSRDN
ncbi:MAG: hypothetical protein ACE5OZ_19450 [Candidatus Heimdallarchaeota archaeon]